MDKYRTIYGPYKLSNRVDSLISGFLVTRLTKSFYQQHYENHILPFSLTWKISREPSFKAEDIGLELEILSEKKFSFMRTSVPTFDVIL